MPTDPGSLRARPIADLVKTARELGVDNAVAMRKPDLVAAIMRSSGADPSETESYGVLEILPDGFGFLRATEYSYLPGPDDVYVSPSQIRRFNLRTGDHLTGRVRAPKENERYLALIKVSEVNDQDPEVARGRIAFENLTAVHASQPLLAQPSGLLAAVDLWAPIGRGDRVLVSGPARAGKSTFARRLFDAAADSDLAPSWLAVAERPEDLTALEQELHGEVVGTVFEETDARHVQVADIAIERARRRAEQGLDVLLVVDSLSRLARAANAVSTPSGHLIGGHLDAAALPRVRRALGSARALAEGGSVTVVALLDDDGNSASAAGLGEELAGVETVRIVLQAPETGHGDPVVDRKRSRSWSEARHQSPEALSRREKQRQTDKAARPA